MRALPAPFFVAAVTLALSCQDSREPLPSAAPAAAAPGSASPAGAPPFDFTALVRRAHFAFHPGARGFTGALDTYTVEATPDAFTLTPRSPAASRPASQGLSIHARAVGRGAVSALAAAPRAAVETAGALAVDRGAAVERLENREEGVEQSYTFAARPAGEGDLVVRLAASGLPYVGRTGGGLHFADPATGLGVRYGRATWVDAAGRRAAVDAAVEGEDIVLRVPAAAVDGAAYPAVLDPVIGPELALDTPIYVPTTFLQTSPAVASNGADYLVVWSDQRGSYQGDVYGARVTDAGVILDPAGIAVVTGTAGEVAPAVAFDGTNYLVVWQDKRNSATTQDDIYGARVTPAGAVLDAGGFPISTAGYAQQNPSLAYDGSEYLVVWEDGRAAGPLDVYGARVTPAGTVLDPNGIAVSIAPGDQTRPRVASNGAGFAVVWADGRVAQSSGIYGARVGADGTVADPLGVPIATTSFEYAFAPGIAYGGTSYLVAWTDDSQAILGERLSPATLASLDASPITVAQADWPRDLVNVAYGNGDYFVSWLDDVLNDRDIEGMWVHASDGAVADAGSPLVLSSFGTPCNSAATASSGTSFLTAFSSYYSGPIDAHRTTVPGAAYTAPFVVGEMADYQGSPAIDYDGAAWMVAWSDRRTGTVDGTVYAARLDAGGNMLDPNGIAVSTATTDQRDVAVSHDASNFFVVWSDHRSGTTYDIYGARLSRASGAVLDPAGLPISTAFGDQTAPRLAFDGTNYLVVWNDTRSGSDQVYGARVPAATGVPIEVGGLAISAGDEDASPAVAFDGARYLVVYTDTQSFPFTTNVLGTRVDPAGTIVDPMGFTIAGVSSAGSPGVAFGAGQYLVAWTYGGSDIYGTRVTPAAGVLDPSGFVIAGSIDTLGYPAVAFDGSAYVTAWTDLTTNRAYAAWNRTDATGFASAQVAGPQVAGGLSLVSDGAGTTMAAYARLEPLPPYGDTRVWARSLRNGAAKGAPCGAVAGCETGYCVDGVCCDTACGGGAPNDCQACSVAAGAAADGTCGPVKQGAVCRPSAAPCDVAEVCSGQSTACPADAKAPDGTPCDDGNACTTGDACAAGVCHGTAVVCTAMDACHAAGTCGSTSGACSNPAVADGTACNDSNACTRVDTCQAGACTGTMPVTCTAMDACHAAGTCDPTSGACSNPTVPDGTPCGLGACVGGACVAMPDAGTGSTGSTSSSATSSSSGAGGASASSSSSSSSSTGTTTSSGSSAASSSGTGGAGSTSSGGGAGGAGTSTSSSTSGAGAGAASSESGSSGAPGSKGGCSCRVGREEEGGTAWALFAIGAAVAAGRRRRARGPAETGGPAGA